MIPGSSISALWTTDTSLTLLAGFGVSLVATYGVRRLAMAMHWYDVPDAGLKTHSRPIPILGGVAMFAGWLVCGLMQRDALSTARTVWIALWIGGTIMALTGLIDDRIHLRPRTRLLLEALVAGVLAYAGIGRGLAFLAVDPGSDAARWLTQSGVGHAVTVLLLIGFLTYTTNATNLIDGLDGLCAGVSAIMGAGFLILTAALIERGIMPAGTGRILLALSAAQIGICLGFLCFNFNPASIFMGDSGSLLLGYNVAAILVLLGDAASFRWLVAGTVMFGFPILDTTLAIVRRWKNGRPLFIGDRSHLYDQLRDRGLSVRQTVMACYAIGVVFAGLGLLALTMISTPILIAVYLIAAAICGGVLIRFGMLRVDDTAARSRQAKA